MFEQEIENIIQNTQAKTIGNGSSIRVADILSAPILPAIKTFFQTEVEGWLKEERSSQLPSGRFRYDEPEVQKQIDSILVRNAILSREEFLSILDKAVKLVFNYICRPQWTLSKFLFKSGNVVPSEEFQSELNYFYDYPYYRDILLRFVEKKGIKEVTLEMLEQLVKRIDEEVIQSCSASELAHLTQPIFDVLHEAQPHKGDEIPIDALMIFFDDKNRMDVLAKLESEQEQHRRLNISMERLVSLLEPGHDRTRSETSHHLEAPEVQPAEAAVKRDEVMQDHRKLDMIPPVVERKETGSPLPLQEPEALEIGERLSRPSVTPTTQQEPISYHIRKQLRKRGKKKVIKRVFQGDAAQYEISLATLNSMKTWGEASMYIDSVFIKNGVDPFSNVAIKFTDVVQEVFLSQARSALPEADSAKGGSASGRKPPA